MFLRHFLFSLVLALPMGCTQFQTGRTYLSEMEHDDSTFFNPKDDFPVVAGDSGKYWMSEEERRERTPASEDELQEDLSSRALRRELRELEGTQSEDNLAFYQQYKQKLSSTSEKIYFLRLPVYERKDYLRNRGFLAENRTPASDLHARMFAVRKNDILMGMSKGDVLESLGKPLRVEVAGNPRYENERWLYRMNGASKYIYFESGQVGGWE